MITIDGRDGWHRFVGACGAWWRRRSVAAVIALTLIGLPALGLVGVVAADLVPDRWVMNALFDATEQRAITIDNYPPGRSVRMIDRFSECKRMTIGLGDPEGVGPFESAVRSPTLGACSTAVPKIVGWAQGEGLSQSFEYSRYWNGSVAVFRPVISTIGVRGARLTATVVLAVLGIVAWRSFASSIGRAAAWAGSTLVLATTDFIDLPGALLHALAWLCLLATVIVLVRHSGSWEWRTLAWAAFVAGAVFLYVADMANPDAAWTAVVGSVGLASLGLRATTVATRMLVAGSAWIGGFAWMWFCKWVIGATVYGVETMRSNVTNAIEGRLTGEYAGLDLGFWGGHDRVWDEWWNALLTPIVLPIAVVTTMVLVVRRGRGDFAATWRSRVVVSGALLIPVVWYAILRNHTQIHAWFVYRSLVTGVAVVLMAWTARPPARGRAPAMPRS